MGTEASDVRTVIAALEGVVSSGDLLKLAEVPAINIHVVGATPSRWSFVGGRSPRFAERFIDGAETLITCDLAGLTGLLDAPDAESGGTIDVIGDRVSLETLAAALRRPLSWLEARGGA